MIGGAVEGRSGRISVRNGQIMSPVCGGTRTSESATASIISLADTCCIVRQCAAGHLAAANGDSGSRNSVRHIAARVPLVPRVHSTLMNRLRELYSRHIKKSCQIERKRKESLVFGRQVGSQMEPDRALSVGRPAIITTIGLPLRAFLAKSDDKRGRQEQDSAENDPV